MQRPIFDQTFELLSAADRLLLAVPVNSTTDAFASMLALSLALEQMGKETTLLCASHVPKEIQFLPGSSQVHEVLEPTREIVIDIPLGDVKSKHVAWEQHEGGIRVLITPERGKEVEGNITPSVSVGRYPWTVIVILGASHLEHLGKPFANHAPFFYETPVINIDRGTANEFFGTANLVQATSGTVSEVVYDLISVLNEKGGDTNLLTSDVATSLYAGLVAGTHSFRDSNTTPHSLMIASRLLEQNADQQSVTQQLLRTRSLATLRLVGNGLAHLKKLDNHILWTTLFEKDLQASEATPDHVPAVLDEITERAGNHDPALIVFESQPDTFKVLMFPGRMGDEDRKTIAQAVSGTTTDTYISTTLENITKDAIEQTLRERILPHLPKRN